MNFLKKFLLVPFVLVFFITYLLIDVSFLYSDPPPWPDEPVFYEVAKNIVNTGKSSTDIYGSLLPELQTQSYDHPPVYFISLGGWMKVFGETLGSIRFFSIFIGALVLVLTYFIARHLTGNKFLALIAVFYLIADYHFMKGTRIGRMEILTCFFMLFAWLLVLIKNKKFKNPLLLGSGTVAGLSFLSHPMGALSLILITLTLFTTKQSKKEKFTQLFFVLMPFLLLTLIWLFTLKDSLASMIIQYQLQITRRVVTKSYFLQLLGATEYFLLFTSYIVSLVSLLLLNSFKPIKNLSLVIASTLITGCLVILSKEMWYVIYFSPVFAILYCFMAKSLKSNPSLTIKTVLITFLILPVFINISLSFSKYMETKDKQHFRLASFTQVFSIKQGTICLSSIPDPYFDLKNNPALELKEFLYLSSEDHSIDQRKIEFLKNCDQVILNYLPDKLTLDYLKENTAHVLPITEGGYTTNLYFLKKSD